MNLSGTANDLTKTFAYNPASQIVSETRSNDAYSQVLANSTQTTVTNGLNQLSTVNGTAATYDGRGNMTTDPVTGKTYSYLPSNNQLYNIPSPFATFTYDGLDRLANVNNGGTVTNYVTDGTDVVAEYNSSNVLQKRYAFDGSGQPLVQFDSAGNRSWMLADERGSIIALANDSAAMTAIDTYDEYGIPGASNQGTFQYAGMMWLVRPGVYAPTYRAYAQHLGRFNQADPIGLLGGVNLYVYAQNNPVNLADPLGLCVAAEINPYVAYDGSGGGGCGDDITVTADKLPPPYIADPQGQLPVEVLSQIAIVVTGHKPTKAQSTNKPKPAYCTDPRYIQGSKLQGAATITKMFGVSFMVFGVGESMFFGTMTAGPGAAAGLPTIAMGARVYAAGSFVSAAGSAMQASAGAPAAKQDVATAGIMSALGAAASAGPVGNFVADVAIGAVTSIRSDPCR